jgi:hypothetical protein
MSATLERGRVPLRVLEERVGGLSTPGKMPFYGFSLPAQACKTGSKLREVKGSVCENCYALRGNYLYTNVQKALWRRLEILEADPDAWVDNLVAVLKRRCRQFTPTPDDPWPAVRAHDAGDLQGVWHLRAICEVARRLRRVRLADGTRAAARLWLPTREYGFVKEFLNGGGVIPRNLTVRLSVHMVDEGPSPGLRKWARENGLVLSTVRKKTILENHGEWVCPAPKQGNVCGKCRSCHDRRIAVICYGKH